jgi:hypothetical protein
VSEDELRAAGIAAAKAAPPMSRETAERVLAVARRRQQRQRRQGRGQAA